MALRALRESEEGLENVLRGLQEGLKKVLQRVSRVHPWSIRDAKVSVSHFWFLWFVLKRCKNTCHNSLSDGLLNGFQNGHDKFHGAKKITQSLAAPAR